MTVATPSPSLSRSLESKSRCLGSGSQGSGFKSWPHLHLGKLLPLRTRFLHCEVEGKVPTTGDCCDYNQPVVPAAPTDPQTSSGLPVPQSAPGACRTKRGPGRGAQTFRCSDLRPKTCLSGPRHSCLGMLESQKVRSNGPVPSALTSSPPSTSINYANLSSPGAPGGNAWRSVSHPVQPGSPSTVPASSTAAFSYPAL